MKVSYTASKILGTYIFFYLSRILLFVLFPITDIIHKFKEFLKQGIIHSKML